MVESNPLSILSTPLISRRRLGMVRGCLEYRFHMAFFFSLCTNGKNKALTPQTSFRKHEYPAELTGIY